MRVPSIEVRHQRSIRLARCEAVPRLMVIAGPNGSGKSTLLNSIRSHSDYANIVYVGPHRAMRKQNVQQRHLLTQQFSFEALLSSPSCPGYEGIRVVDGNRDPWGYDETANYLKHTLCQIEVDRLQAIGTRVDRDGEIKQGSLIDPWTPLRELTNNLLPHMTFEKIDATNRDQVKVLFRVHRLDPLVDLDDLSSGEKSIIQMFYPLVERDIRARVKEIAAGPQEIERPDICVLIDEPELHLHPNLQIKVLDYLRVLTSHQKAQVIVATHSPTVVEAATFEELFLLRPVEIVDDDENQLVRVAQDDERLAALRSLFGSTQNLTALQPVIVVEGHSEDGTGRAISDRRLYRALHQGFDRVTIVSGGGKRECMSLVQALRPALAEFSKHLKVVGLLDRDVDHNATDAVQFLPVSMIENFLLDPDVLFEAIESVRERTGLRTVDDIAASLDQMLTNSEPRETGRRAALILGSAHFFPPADPSTVCDKARAFIDDVQYRYSEQSIEKARSAAMAAVEEIRTKSRRREEFDGKKLLADFFRKHLHSTSLSHHVFTFYAARRAKRRKQVLAFFDEFFSRLC